MSCRAVTLKVWMDQQHPCLLLRSADSQVHSRPTEQGSLGLIPMTHTVLLGKFENHFSGDVNSDQHWLCHSGASDYSFQLINPPLYALTQLTFLLVFKEKSQN